jgi:dynein heavy chain
LNECKPLDQGWEDLMRLITLGGAVADEPSPFTKIADHVEKNGGAWHKWYDLEAPEQSPFPGKYSVGRCSLTL